MLVGCVAKKYLMGLCLSDLIYKRPLHGLPTCDIYSVIPRDRITAVLCPERGTKRVRGIASTTLVRRLQRLVGWP